MRSYTVKADILGVPDKLDAHTTEGKAELVKAYQDVTAAIDSSGFCLFTVFV